GSGSGGISRLSSRVVESGRPSTPPPAPPLKGEGSRKGWGWLTLRLACLAPPLLSEEGAGRGFFGAPLRIPRHLESRLILALPRQEQNPPRQTAAALGPQPRPAAQHAVRPLLRAGRVGRRRLAVIVLVEPVVAPLRNVAVHVVQAPQVGRIRADLRRPSHL